MVVNTSGPVKTRVLIHGRLILALYLPSTLATVLAHVTGLQNQANASLIQEFYAWMKDNQTSESYQKNNLKAITNFAEWNHKQIPTGSFFDIQDRETILKFLNTKRKDTATDPDGKWITTWNDYLDRIKVFFRWLYNYQKVTDKARLPPSEWKTPEFIQIKHIKSSRASPYTANEIWDIDELLSIIKYEPNLRNRAAIALLWDLDARNHEVTNIELRNVRLKEQYGEGEIPQGKTGSGPILLTVSFPYVRDWLNNHPLKDYPKARLICDLKTGKPLKPERLWDIMMQLRDRIETLVREGQIQDDDERKKLENMLRTKRWNPYCFRHSAITHDSDYLPGYALNKKVRWTMTSRQPGRYIKNRMGNTLKNTILEHNGIEIDPAGKPKPTTRTCPKCGLLNAITNDYCSKRECAYPLTTRAYDEIKKIESETLADLKEIKEFAAMVRNSKIMDLLRKDT